MRVAAVAPHLCSGAGRLVGRSHACAGRSGLEEYFGALDAWEPIVRPRLRRSMVALGGVLLFVALLASAALVILTTVLSHQAMRVSIADARTRASLQTKIALLWYARASDLADSGSSPVAMGERAHAESELHSALATTVELAAPPRAPLGSLVRKTDDYIALRRRLEAEGLPLGVVLDHSTPALESVFADLQEHLATDDAWAGAAKASAQRWHRIGDVIGISAGILLIVGFAVAVVGTALLVERPILALTGAMAHFASGEESSRSVPGGARELRQMATTFNELADRLVRQNRDRLAFLAGVAHDLRNPLSAVRLATDAVRRSTQPPTPEKAARTLELVARQVDRLDRMVGDLLDATRIEAGGLELRSETSDLRLLVERVVELFRPSATTHEIAVLTPREPVLVDCDPTRIEQVLNNLVSNALKYSPGGGRVTVATALDGTEAVVQVADEGIGIAPEDRDRIFEPFRRTRESRELVPGVGLGLSVARKIVGAHGGRLEVESDLGRGSTFRMRLRARQATGPSALRPAPTRAHGPLQA